MAILVCEGGLAVGRCGNEVAGRTSGGALWCRCQGWRGGMRR